MTSELDKALAALREERADISASIDVMEARIGIIDAEIRGMERARELFGPVPVATALTRRSVQVPVLALFGEGKGTWDEAGIVERTGLPRESIHKFILRAVQKGMLRRLPTSAPGPDAEYGMGANFPGVVQKEAAE